MQNYVFESFANFAVRENDLNQFRHISCFTKFQSITWVPVQDVNSFCLLSVENVQTRGAYGKSSYARRASSTSEIGHYINYYSYVIAAFIEHTSR